MKKQKQTVLVHGVSLGKREGAPHKATQPLPEYVVEPLNMTRLSLPLTCRPMLLCGKDFGIRFPEVGEQQTTLVAFGNTLPQQATRLLASVSDGIRDNLTGSAALGQPDPAFVSPALDERPHLVHLQNVSLFGLC